MDLPQTPTMNLEDHKGTVEDKLAEEVIREQLQTGLHRQTERRQLICPEDIPE